MAKAKEQPATLPAETITLAERLFVTAWHSSRGYEASHLARLCLTAAAEFRAAANGFDSTNAIPFAGAEASTNEGA